MSQRPPILEPTKRIVRQEAFFGCSICGNPLLEYAHIIPYEVSQDNRPDNLVALCPNHHTEYDLDGFSIAQIRQYKLNPFNKGRDIKKTFNIAGFVPIIEAGTNICRNTPVLLSIDGKNIVTLHKEDNQLIFNALFYNRNNDLIAYIRNNEWCAVNKKVWDIVYRTVTRNLTIKTKPRDIVLSLRISSGIVHFSGRLYYNGFKVVISRNQMTVGNNSCFMRGCSFIDCVTAIGVETSKGSIGMGSSQHEHEFRTPIMIFLRQGKSAFYETFLIPRGRKFCNKFQL